MSGFEGFPKPGLGGGSGGSGGAIASYTLDDDASQDVEDFAGGGYDEVELHFDLLPKTDATQLQLLCKHNGAYKTATYGQQGSSAAWGGGSQANSAPGAATEINLVPSGATWSLSNATHEHATGVITIRKPDEITGLKYVEWEINYRLAGGALGRGKGTAVFDGTDKEKALEGVRFKQSSGNLDGTIKVVARNF